MNAHIILVALVTLVGCASSLDPVGARQRAAVLADPSLPPAARVAIEEHRIERGMPMGHVVAAWGMPWNRAIDRSANGEVTILQYCRWRDQGYQGLCTKGSRPIYLRFVNEILIGWTEF